MKGRRAGQMHAPVKAYMSTNLTTASPASTVREAEDLLFSNNIGHLPVISGKRLVGIITRTDILNFSRTEKRKRLQAMEDLKISPAWL